MTDLPTSGARSFGAPRDGGTRVHNGADFRAPNGTPVYAAAGGLVRHAATTFTPHFAGYGRLVTIDGEDGTSQLYAHLESVAVEPGALVAAGQQLGTAGRTAFTVEVPDRLLDYAHLHFEVSAKPYPLPRAYARMDPIAWLAESGRLHPIERIPSAPADPFDPGPEPPPSPAPSQPYLPPSPSLEPSVLRRDAERYRELLSLLTKIKDLL